MKALSQLFSACTLTRQLSTTTIKNDVVIKPRLPPMFSDTRDNVSVFEGEENVVRVVLLGWLGAKTKHLKRYADWYSSRGVNVITFIVKPKDLLMLDQGRRLAKRISELGKEVASWVSEKQENGRERCLLFHTFSNTGWIVYGALLDSLQGRQDFMEKIKGCVVDSGGADPTNPQIWAAGCAAALRKKRRSSAKINGSEGEVSVSKMQVKKPQITETMLLLLAEKFFSFILNLPDLNLKWMAL